jgi:hypothetical protein
MVAKSAPELAPGSNRYEYGAVSVHSHSRGKIVALAGPS